MKVKHLRQTGAADAPASLDYGCLAVNKAGRLFVGKEDNLPLAVTEPVEHAISATNTRLENTTYDVKMLQLQDILNGSEPAMICGFAEGFKNSSKQGSLAKATLNTSAHRVEFDGITNGSGTQTVAFSNTASTGTDLVGETAWWTLEPLCTNIQNVTISWSGAGMDDTYSMFWPHTFTLYGSADGASWSVINCTYTSLSQATIAVTDVGCTFHLSGNYDYRFYKIHLGSGSPGVPERVPHLPGITASDKGDFYAYSGYFADVSVEGTKQLTADGYYQTKDLPMGAEITDGELYLHYSALPAEAFLTPKVKIGASDLKPLTSVYQKREVTIGGTALFEDKYRLPTFPAANTLAVKVEGHRKNIFDKLHLYDILVAAR